MIIVDRQQELADYIAEQTHGAYTPITGRFFGLERNGKLVSVVACTDYTGRSIGYHIAATGMLNMKFLTFCFDYAFNYLKVNRILTTLDSVNIKSLNLSQRLGFTIEHIIEAAGKDGDLIILSMKREQCYLLDKL